ncbi:MAG: hypothetical protein LBU76_00915 [Azoarcus sp.]|jgi:hypothetical protein|nr:hypothetical protein [Azoarcus sp.]
MLNIDTLPEKGIKREEAILALGANADNGEVLFQLANSEKGKCKTAAQKALAQLEYEPASILWKKLVKGKNMGESIFAKSCSDCVSEQIAPVVIQFLSDLLKKAENAPLDKNQVEHLRFCVSIMLGKSSDEMLNAYRFIAEHNNGFASLKQTAGNKYDNNNHWQLGGFLRVWNATPNEMEKVFPLVLTASIIKNQDVRLMGLADELFAKHGGAWLVPVFMKSILTENKDKAYEDFSHYLSESTTAPYILNALGMLDYNDYPKEYQYKRNKPVGYFALVFWGNLKYGAYDTQFVVTKPVDLDERWLYALAKNSGEEKPKVAWQCYNRRRGGVLYESYDEMLLGLLPEEVKNDDLKNILYSYFSERSKIVKVEDSISVYNDALQRLQD